MQRLRLSGAGGVETDVMRITMLFAIMASIGCIGGSKDPNCQWPPHQARVLDLSSRSDRRHLADDAQTAEDLAIRHADASRSPDWQANRGEYRRVREECRARLNASIAQQHSVPLHAVDAAVDDRRVWLDLLVVAAFAGLFIGLTVIVTSSMLRGSLAESRMLASAMLLVASLGAGTIGVLGGSVFVGLVESVRLGNGHVSYRVDRVPLRHSRLETFTAGALGFIAIGAVQFHRKRASNN